MTNKYICMHAYTIDNTGKYKIWAKRVRERERERERAREREREREGGREGGGGEGERERESAREREREREGGGRGRERVEERDASLLQEHPRINQKSPRHFTSSPGTERVSPNPIRPIILPAEFTWAKANLWVHRAL